MSVSQEARRQLGARETLAAEIGALDAAASIKCRELVRESRRRQFGETDPIGIAIRIAAPRTQPAFEGLWVAQDALARQMFNEIALHT